MASGSRFPVPVSPDLDIERRIRRFRRTWHASDLWPGVTEAAFLAATAELARVTAVLAGSPAAQAAIGSGVDSRVLGLAAHVTGMGPLVGYWIERGRLDAPPDVAALFRTHLDHGRRRAAGLRLELERVLAVLRERGVEATVLKGGHTGWVYFPEPGTRPMADLDLLVDRTALSAARDALAAVGFAPVATNRGRGTWRPPGRRVPHSLEMPHADDPWELDLHVSLDRWFAEVVPARLGPVGPKDLVPLDVGEQPAHCLAQPLLTALLALHVSDHFEMTGLVRLVELAWVVRTDRDRGMLDWPALLARLRVTGASRFVYPAFELTEKLLPGTVDLSFRAAIREDASEAVRHAVDHTEPGGAMRLFERSMDLRLMWLDGWRSGLRWIAWRLWPRLGDAPASLPEAARLTAGRVWRVLTGRMRWRRSG